MSSIAGLYHVWCMNNLFGSSIDRTLGLCLGCDLITSCTFAFEYVFWEEIERGKLRVKS